jgi:hypothetical protein
MDFIGGERGEKEFDAKRKAEQDKEKLEQARDLEDLLVLVRSLGPYEIRALKEKLIRDREDEKRNYVLPGIKDANPDKHNAEVFVPFAPGQEIKVRRSSGEIEDGWVYMGLDMDYPGKLLVTKSIPDQNDNQMRRELRKSVKLSDLIEVNK